MQRHCYLTRRPYNRHPIGSKCFAFRIDCGRKLVLEFPNGDIIELPGSDYLAGIEDSAWSRNVENELIPLWEEGANLSSDGEVTERINEMIMEFKREAR